MQTLIPAIGGVILASGFLQTPKAFANLQPRVARISTLPWESNRDFPATMKGLRELFAKARLSFCELLQSSRLMHAIDPRANAWAKD